MLTKIFDEKESDIVILYKRLHDFEKQIPTIVSIDRDDLLNVIETLNSFYILESNGYTVDEAFIKIEALCNTLYDKISLAFITITNQIYEEASSIIPENKIPCFEIMTSNRFYENMSTKLSDNMLSTHAVKEICDYANFKENVRITVLIKKE